MPPDCTSPPSLEVDRDSNENDIDGLKFHFGGKLNFNEVDNTVKYVGGNTFSWGALRSKEMNMKELYKIIYLFVEGEVVDVLSIHFKKPNVSMDNGLYLIENDEDVAALVASWIEDGKVEVFVELTDKCVSMFIQPDSVLDDVGAGGIKDKDNHVGDDVGFDGDDENGDNSDEDDHFDVSFGSDSDEDDERIQLIQNAKSFVETTANIEPVLELIRRKASDQNVGGESDDNYSIETNYMEDPNCNWSMDEDEEVVSRKTNACPDKAAKLKEDAENEAAADLELQRNDVESSSKVKERCSQSNRKCNHDPSPRLSTPKKTRLTIGSTDVAWITKKRSPRKNIDNSHTRGEPMFVTTKLWRSTQTEAVNEIDPQFKVGPKLVKKKKRETQ
ncbi:hypothetical protein ACFE04_002162 [Oxalis oulophora]